MQLLASADLHGNLETYRWLVETAKFLKPDLLLLAGDLLAAGENYDTVKQDQFDDVKRIESVLSGVPCPLFYIAGNDDWIEPRFASAQFRPLHGRKLEFDGYRFVGYQYSLPFMGGVFEKSEDQIESDLVGLQCLLDSRTVLVTHSPAKGILDGGHGSSSLASMLEKTPVLAHIHGHSHSSFGRLENRFNVAAGYEPRAMVIDLRTMLHQILQDR